MDCSVDQNGLVIDGTAADFIETPNMGGSLKPSFLIMHYTAGSTLNGAVDWFQNPNAKASAHIVIGRDGAVKQMVKFHRVAWHAGESYWGNLKYMNQYAIGIELVNAGKLKKREDGKWVNWANKVVPPDEVAVLTHKNEKYPAGWQLYTESQLRTAISIAFALNREYGFLDILGHDDIAPDRKVDPGPAFPIITFRSKVMGRE